MLNKKFTPFDWREVQAGYATMVYGPNGERVCKVMDNKMDAELIAIAPNLVYLVSTIYNSLPSNRDWLDPEVEKCMKYVVSEYMSKEDEA